MKAAAVAALALGLMAAAAPAVAHHSYAVYTRDKRETVAGVVHEFRWTNPHAWIELNVPNGKGGYVRWSIECNSPNMLSRIGWSPNSLKPGDKVSMVVHPMRNGGKGGSLLSLTLPNGVVLSETRGTL